MISCGEPECTLLWPTSMSDQSHKSYADAMNEWASREGRASFTERSRVSMWMPDPFSHPLVKLIESSEVAAARAGKELGLLPGADKEKRPVGRPPGAASARDKAPPPLVTIAKRAG